MQQDSPSPNHKKKLVCENCQSDVDDSNVECPHCTFPLKGSDADKNRFLGKQIYIKSELEKGRKKIKQAAYILYGIATLYMLNVVFKLLSASGNIEVPLWLGFMYFYLAYKVKNRPILFISLGLGLQVIFSFIVFVSAPTAILQGLAIRLLILIGLGIALYQAILSQKLKQKYHQTLPIKKAG